ncbi:hypothetical protein BKA62DRAFT_759324 [Auriculariales sp. MPI-PUGE-AT-0066]|nr:hypothetical protein BKA62DRAFT_759324 [Auriculariales sp. MPI-PUGE-AT-0066]
MLRQCGCALCLVVPPCRATSSPARVAITAIRSKNAFSSAKRSNRFLIADWVNVSCSPQAGGRMNDQQRCGRRQAQSVASPESAFDLEEPSGTRAPRQEARSGILDAPPPVPAPQSTEQAAQRARSAFRASGFAGIKRMCGTSARDANEKKNNRQAAIVTSGIMGMRHIAVASQIQPYEANTQLVVFVEKKKKRKKGDPAFADAKRAFDSDFLIVTTSPREGPQHTNFPHIDSAPPLRMIWRRHSELGEEEAGQARQAIHDLRRRKTSSHCGQESLKNAFISRRARARMQKTSTYKSSKLSSTTHSRTVSRSYRSARYGATRTASSITPEANAGVLRAARVGTRFAPSSSSAARVGNGPVYSSILPWWIVRLTTREQAGVARQRYLRKDGSRRPCTKDPRVHLEASIEAV